MTAWLAFLAFGSLAQVGPADADMARCRDPSSERDERAVVSACSAVLERGTLHGVEFAQVQALRARAYVRLGDYRHAAPDFREAFRAGVTEPPAANGLCWSLAVLGESLDEALAACDARLRVAPDDPETLDSRGLVFLKLARFQEAWNDYDRAVRINPNGISWLYGRGIAALRLGRAEQARADFIRAVDAYPQITAMYLSYGIRP